MTNSNAIQEFAKLTTDAGRCEFLEQHRELVRPDVVMEIAEAVRKHVRVDLQEALHLAEGGMSIAAMLGNGDAQALACRAKANALYMLGQNQASVDLHDQAITLFAGTGNEAELGRSFSASLQPLALLGFYDRAFANASRAREIFASQNDSLRLARLEINFGNILHRQDRFTEALVSYRRALGELWPDKDLEGVAVVLHNIAVCLIGLNDFRQAIETHECAREFCERHNMPLLVVQADYNIAALYYQRGEYGRAIARLRATREVCQTIGDDHHFALCQLDLAEVYIELNLNREAAQIAAEAFACFERLAMGYEAAKCLAFRAIGLSRQQCHEEALALFSEARERFVKEDNHAWPSLIDLYQAHLLCEAGRTEEARRLCEAVLPFFQTAGIPGKAALCQLLLARLALEAGDCEVASQGCRDAIGQAGWMESPYLKYEAGSLLGRALEAQDRAAEAWGAYYSAHREMEALRSSLGNEVMKIAFMSDKFEVYERLVALSLAGVATEQGARPLELAFQFMEQAKNRSLRDLMCGRAEPAAEAVEGPMARHKRRLREELNWFRRRIEQQQLGRSPSSPEIIAELQSQARQREEALLSAMREDPAGDSTLGSSTVATLEELRRSLPADAGLLEYFRVGGGFLAVVITREREEVVTLGGCEQVERSLRLLRFQFERRRMMGAGPASPGSLGIVREHLRRLHEAVFAPVAGLLAGCRRLVIVPHDLLHNVPFQALFDGERYVADSFCVAFAPSASIFALCARSRRPEGNRALILGVPDESAPRILDEVEGIARMLREPELYIGERATVSVLRERGLASRYIHIASHGHFRPDSPLFSGVMLGGEHLDVYDLYQLRLPAELITLSGCATGLNVLEKGDELLGIERGLLNAGAQCLLLTMWDVHDGSSAIFVRLFYQGLGEHGDKGLALQQAQQALRAEYPHPYDWAPFVLVGNAFGDIFSPEYIKAEDSRPLSTEEAITQ